MPAQILRPYQQQGLAKILAAYGNKTRTVRKVIVVAPTGSGKTSLFAYLASQIAESGQRVVVLVHRRELAQQAANRFQEFGTDFGFIMAGEPRKPYARVQIASVQTLIRRTAPPADLVICDEAHLSTAKTWQTILENYPKARILGVTATPWRLSGRPLVGAYDDCVVVSTPNELRELGFLCGYAGFSYLTPDLSAVKTTGGDYNEQQSAEAMKAPQIVDNVVEQWLKHASHLSTVVFAVTVDHSQTLCTAFKAAGVTAEHLDGTTGLETRKAILARVESGVTRVLCNVGVAVEGLDIPRLKCCVLARPTKSKARAIQMMGRVRRPWQGQTARIHDHAFNIKLHGLPDADCDYTLGKPEEPPSLTQCADCFCLYSGPSCPACGREPEPREQGERILTTVPDAEQFTFGSEESLAETATQRPPVEVQWSDIGKMIQGVFERQWTETTSYGPRERYLIRGEKRHYSVPGTTRLNALMKRVAAGDSIRLTYTGNTELGGGKTRKEFKLEKDEPDPAQSKAARDAEIVRLRVEEKLGSLEITKRLGVSKTIVGITLRVAGCAWSRSEAQRHKLESDPIYAASCAAAHASYAAGNAAHAAARTAKAAVRWRGLAPQIDALVLEGVSVTKALTQVSGHKPSGIHLRKYRQYSALPQSEQEAPNP